MMVFERADLQTLRRELLEREARLQSLIEHALVHDRQRAPAAGTARDAPAVRPGGQLGLTEREVQILQLVVRGHTNREIGAQLGVGPATIRNRLGRIYQKLCVMTRTHAAVRALELGLCSAGPVEGS
jgi:DNA-binding NarL/FixJ family response regulator